ncbi:DinB family protein [Plantactinospora sp. KLBMP9567]|uniref:DinB family protein n=1 Tax=Plantactinospora sp. KLBMP9567 TaxID=3085900 RepID=UPI0029828E60|nr:DinB family protein [Plantactinospora sp. KLBMP9567]MDW5329874.1 DinB family protein [Plantactinospora sp. KLBMP9567]
MSAPPERRPATLDDPPVDVSDPHELLLRYLDWYREALLRKLDGLTEPELRAPVGPLGWSPLGLVKHLGWVERRWMRWGFAAEDVLAYPSEDDEAEWRVPADESVGDVLAAYHDEVRRSRALAASADLAEPARLGGRFRAAAQAPSLGRILFHLFQEYARHVGHLDIARELLDGTVGE